MLSEIMYCAVKWLKFTSKILIYVYLYLIKLNTNSKSEFVNKGSPVSVVLCTPYTDQFIYIYILLLNTWDIKCRHPTMSLVFNHFGEREGHVPLCPP